MLISWQNLFYIYFSGLVAVISHLYIQFNMGDYDALASYVALALLLILLLLMLLIFVVKRILLLFIFLKHGQV